jgi:hypothetical protein
MTRDGVAFLALACFSVTCRSSDGNRLAGGSGGGGAVGGANESGTGALSGSSAAVSGRAGSVGIAGRNAGGAGGAGQVSGGIGGAEPSSGGVMANAGGGESGAPGSAGAGSGGRPGSTGDRCRRHDDCVQGLVCVNDGSEDCTAFGGRCRAHSDCRLFGECGYDTCQESGVCLCFDCGAPEIGCATSPNCFGCQGPPS